MSASISRPVQLFALAGLLAILGAGGTLMLSRHASPSAAPPAAPAKHPTTVAAKPTVAPATTPAAVVKAPAPPVRPVTPAPAAPRLVAADGLPMPLAKALRHHRVVVVSLFDPQATTDALSFAEARSGAAAARAGFLAVSVLDDDVAGPLTAALPGGGLLPDPGVLVYRAPHSLVVRLDGFADRDAVAQAAAGAITAPPLTGTTP